MTFPDVLPLTVSQAHIDRANEDRNRVVAIGYCPVDFAMMDYFPGTVSSAGRRWISLRVPRGVGYTDAATYEGGDDMVKFTEDFDFYRGVQPCVLLLRRS